MFTGKSIVINFKIKMNFELLPLANTNQTLHRYRNIEILLRQTNNMLVKQSN